MPEGTEMMGTDGKATSEKDGHDDDYDDDYDERESQCGVGSFRPGWLQPFASIKAFTVTLSLWSLFGSMNFSYYTAVISEIEKHFGLPSSLSGFIKNVDNIGYMSTVLIFSHFCRYANKPRLFTAVTLLSSAAIFLFAMPYFIYGGVNYDKWVSLNATIQNMTSAKKASQAIEYCDGIESSAKETANFCKRQNVMSSINTGAVAFFILSELLQGIGQSPKFALSLTYMDDNAKDKSPRYFSFMFAMRAFAPTLGFLMGAWATSIYVDLSDPNMDSTDPRWVGAWWIGFVICAACSAFWAIPMIFFPPVLRGAEGKVVSTKKTQDLTETAKDLPRAIGRLLKNKVYMMLVLTLSFEVYIMGFVTFLPKYIAQQFGVSPGVASVITGMTTMFSFALGPIIMGQIMGCLKRITPFKALQIVSILTILSTLFKGASMFITCDEPQWAGHLDKENPDLSLPCNGNCSCDATSFIPVCGDNVNYYSPCHAGCTDTFKTNSTVYYTGCSCIPDGVATSGICKRQCTMPLVWYSILMLATKLAAGMDKIPTMTLFMRLVHPKDKAISLAALSAWLQIMSFPAPIVFGLIIDTTCLIQQGCADSRRGACLLYDNDLFRWRLHGFSFAIKAVACVLYVITMFISRGIDYHDQEYGENVDENKNKKELVPTNGADKNKDLYKNGKLEHDPEEAEILASF